jgi:hypothetical protein
MLMKRSLLIAALTLLTAATCLWALGPTGVVTTVDGVKHEGEVTESEAQVIVRTHGVATVLAREHVLSIDYTTYADRFESALKALPEDDTAGRVALAREAFDRREYDLALKATSSAIDFDPMNRAARQLESLINSQIQLEGRAGAATEPADGDSAGDVPKPLPRPATRPSRRLRGLDETQVNRVRQAELTEDDDKVRIQFRDNVRKRFVDSQPDGNFRAFSNRSDVDQALTILAKGTIEMADDLIIRNDPKGIQTFGRRIQSAIVQGCATSGCHGGNGAGDFRLLTGTPDSATMITNFYLINDYAKQLEPDENRGAFSPNAVNMVDRGDGKNSLLYQYALPRARAKQKHPPVRNWDGLIHGDDDRLARDLLEWMNVDLVRRPREYGFHFKLGGEPASTQPTTQPTTETTTPTTNPAEP